MRFEYEVTTSDYRAALELHRRQKLSRRVSWAISTRFLPAVGLLILGWSLFAYITGITTVSQEPPITLIVPFAFLLLPLINRLTVRRIFGKLFPLNARKFSIDIDEDRVVCTNEGVSETTFKWNAVVRFAQNGKATLLYLSEIRFLFFPTKIFSEAQQSELKQMVLHQGIKIY